MIEAILELKDIGGAPIGETPPNWEIIVDPETGLPIDGIQYPVVNGQLWFDQRQGRLFIWVGDGWYQTNGADGITAVQDTPPQGPPLGSYWYNTTNGTLYLFTGTQWTAVGGQPAIDTMSLPLSNPVIDGFSNLHNTHRVLPDPINLIYQADANHFFVECLSTLDEKVDELLQPAADILHMGENPPLDPYEGQLWFDTASVDLLIYYDDGKSKQWVPTSAAYITDIRVTELEGRLEGLVISTKHDLDKAKGELNNRADSQLHRIETLENENIARKNEIDLINDPDLSNYSTQTDLLNAVEALEAEIATVRGEIKPTDHLATTSYVNDKISSVNSSLNNYASLGQLANLQSQIPDVSSYVTQQDIDNSVSAVTTGYLQQTGGRVDGALVLENREVTEPTLDFSNSVSYSRNAMRFKTNGAGDDKVTFGTNNHFWEYAWQFESEEDFCWKYGDQKIMSIAKDGVVCNKLMIGQFQPNQSTGRLVMNTIDVAQELASLKAEIAQLKTQLG